MTYGAKSEMPSNPRLRAFYERVRNQCLCPLWQVQTYDAPSGKIRPWLWPWESLRENMLEACEIVALGGDDGAARRVLTLANPTQTAGPWPTGTLTAACQLVLPGEEAPSHRHSMAALRFIIEGSGGYTIVDGEPLSMQPGDFILTPSWTWHGHAHEGIGKMLWLDILDVPLVRSLDWQFYEEYSEPRSLQLPEKPPDDSLRRYGNRSMLPTWTGKPNVPYSPLFSYKWTSTRESLYRLTECEASPYEGYALRFTNPFTGGPVMPTISASMHLLTARQQTKARRSLANYIHHAVEGSGHSVIDGQRFDWKQHDTFCVPTWCWQEHAAGSNDAILFTCQDEPVLQALALYREEAYGGDGHQKYLNTFTGERPVQKS
jgi:gentisate 1,2-dioxygenase